MGKRAADDSDELASLIPASSGQALATEWRQEEGTGARSGGVSRSPLRFFNFRVDLAVLIACFVVSWQAGRLPFWGSLQSGLGRLTFRGGFHSGLIFDGPTGPVDCQGESPFLGRQEEAFNMTSHRAKLVTQIRLNAAIHLIQPCVRMVLGEEWFDNNTNPMHTAFSQGHQDWVMYHSFFSHMEYGEGFYVDVGANDPIIGSNTFFFDACLGWQGLCMEPNPMYAESFKANRTCVHIKNCVGPEEKELTLSAHKGSKGQVSEGGEGIKVMCRPLQDVLADHKVGMTHKGQRRIDFASVDIEGFEALAFRCFPFDLFNIPVWLIETVHQGGYSVARMMARAGFWMSPQLLIHWYIKGEPIHVGYHMDNLFVRWRQPKWMYARNATAAAAAAAGDLRNPHAGGRGTLGVPTLVLGPDFLPGGVLEGESYVAPCIGNASSGCPEQVPAVEDVLEYNDMAIVKECKAYNGVKHRLSNPSSD